MVSELFDAKAWRAVPGFDFTDITYHRAIGIGAVRVAFNRPEVRNAFRPGTVDELYRALDHARMSADVGCVILTGNGPSPKDGGWAFCSGGDQRIRGKDGYKYAEGETAASIDPARAGRLHILEVQRLIRQGDRYVEDKYFAQAVDSFQKALALEPDSAEVMGRLVGALLYNKQMIDAEEMIDHLFAVNGNVSVGVVHNHSFGMCSGDLTITSRGIAYAPQRGDHGFTAAASQITGFDEGKIGNSTNVLPALTIRFRDAQNKDKKFDFLVPVYLNAKPITPLASPYDVFFGDEEAIADTARVHRMLIRLIGDKLGRR